MLWMAQMNYTMSLITYTYFVAIKNYRFNWIKWCSMSTWKATFFYLLNQFSTESRHNNNIVISGVWAAGDFDHSQENGKSVYRLIQPLFILCISLYIIKSNLYMSLIQTWASEYADHRHHSPLVYNLGSNFQQILQLFASKNTNCIDSNCKGLS